ncbi:hypothetical protein ACHAW6_012708 [Cyclotella cf. meneghiniana]
MMIKARSRLSATTFFFVAQILAASIYTHAFLQPFRPTDVSRTRPQYLDTPVPRAHPVYSSSTDADATDLESEIRSMRVGAIKQELESYGISTKTFLEKSELVEALVQARKEGKTPVAPSASPAPSNTVSSPTDSDTSTSAADRQERLNKEIEQCKSMKVAELKQELESYGISTASYFEKSEFVRAVAEARVDGITKQSKKKKRRSVADDDDEVEEVAAKVEVITSDSVGPKTKKSREASAGGSANPFAGAGVGGSDFGPFGGGMGGMGGIADMLKNMGGGMPGGMGANPFGGAGGSPFGGAGMADAMKKAQEAMSNPKTRAVIEKAQKNPKVMAAVQECMGNPMAMAKYMNDPEVGPIIKELQDALM